MPTIFFTEANGACDIFEMLSIINNMLHVPLTFVKAVHSIVIFNINFVHRIFSGLLHDHF